MSATIILAIRGIQCEGCVKNLTGLLGRHPSVTDVTVTISPPQAVITHKGQESDRAELIALVEEAGFEAS